MAENQVPTSKTIKVRVVSHPDAQYIGKKVSLLATTVKVFGQ